VDKETKKHIQREAEEFGCFGLIHGCAKNIYSRNDFYASSATKADGPFYCPTCNSDAIIRKCSERIDHFAHSARLTPAISAHESELHLQCKNEICEQLSHKFPDGKWAIERTIPENKSKGIPELRPDISGRINGEPVAIEIQVSALGITKILKRCSAYSKRGIALLWIVPLHTPLENEPIRPRLYERYLHSIYFGRTYYWWKGQGLKLKAIHYAPATRHIEYKEWHENGTHMSGGGYDLTYKVIKTPLPGPEMSIDTDFKKIFRNTFTPENERKAVPEILIWQDKNSAWW
jgi:competence protein CoiA